MKKILLLVMCWPMILSAQNGVTVTGLNVNSGTMTFTVSWGTPMPMDVWSDSVWVFVDYNDGGVMKRLRVTGGTATAGTVTKLAGNDQGLRIVGNARTTGNFSAKVEYYYNNPQTAVAGACAYASNYPPVGEYITPETVKFTGTPPYHLTFTDGSGTTTRQGVYTIPSGMHLASFVDATGGPGTFTCKIPLALPLIASAQGYCEGSSGVTFTMDGTELGVTYQLIKDNAIVVATLTGTGNPASFNNSHTEGTYTAKSVVGEYCAVAMYGERTVSEYPLPGAPTITSTGTACVSFTLSATPGAGGDGILWEDGSILSARTVTSAGTYFAVSTSRHGCKSQLSAPNTVIDLPNAANPDGGPCYVGETPSFCDQNCRATCATVSIASLNFSNQIKYAVRDPTVVSCFCATNDCTGVRIHSKYTSDGVTPLTVTCGNARCTRISAGWSSATAQTLRKN
jgi:hypothetical protein